MRYILAAVLLVGDIIVGKAMPAIIHQLPHETPHKLHGSLLLLGIIVGVNLIVAASIARAALKTQG